MFDFKNTNILFITIDSCTFESALIAKTPNLNKLSQTYEAETNATFTYPAHHSFFAEHLPMMKRRKFFGKYKSIWRSETARKNIITKSLIIFNGRNIIDFYEKIGFNVLGYGGVGFFNNYSPNTDLPKLFKKFTYFGRKEFPSNDYPRPVWTFPLNNVDKIIKDINASDSPFFVFINEIATHIPYDNPNVRFSESYLELTKNLYLVHYLKHVHPLSKLPFTNKEIARFKPMQTKSLEWVDEKIGLLIKKLPKNRKTLIIICSDHGEEFGEGGRFGHAHHHPSIMKVPLWYCILQQ